MSERVCGCPAHVPMDVILRRMGEALGESDFTHFDGCLTETTWDEDDCTCRPSCPICGQTVRPDGRCRWAVA